MPRGTRLPQRPRAHCSSTIAGSTRATARRHKDHDAHPSLAAVRLAIPLKSAAWLSEGVVAWIDLIKRPPGPSRRKPGRLDGCSWIGVRPRDRGTPPTTSAWWWTITGMNVSHVIRPVTITEQLPADDMLKALGAMRRRMRIADDLSADGAQLSSSAAR